MNKTVLDVPKMLDLAFGAPQIGVVNFNLLYALLHTIVKQINFNDVVVEIQGTQLCQPEMLRNLEGKKAISVEEYKMEKGKRILIHNRRSKDVKKVILVRNTETEDDTSSVKHESSEYVPVDSGQLEDEQFKSLMQKLDENEMKLKKMEKKLANLSSKCTDIVTSSDFLDKIDILEKKIFDINKKSPKQLKKPDLDAKNNQERMKSGADTPNTTEKICEQTVEELKTVKSELGSVKTVLKRISLKVLTKASFAEIENLLSGIKVESDKAEEECCTDSLEDNNEKLDTLVIKLDTLTERLLDVEKEVSDLMEKSATSKVLDEDTTNMAPTSIVDLHNEIATIKRYVASADDNFCTLLDVQAKLEECMVSLGRNVEDLQHTKLDKDEIDELLAEKADYSMLQRKVSQDYFDANKKDLECTVKDAILTFKGKEQSICEALEEIRKDLETKINKEDFAEATKIIEEKIKSQTEKLNAIRDSQQYTEAAGSKYLRDVSCISCNKYVLMKKENNASVALPPMPRRKDTKTYLNYELDIMKDQRKGADQSRNMHHFESAINRKGLITDGKARQLCNRYCGGSHTIITTKDRVEKIKCTRVHGVRAEVAECVCVKLPTPPPSAKSEEKEELKKPVSTDYNISQISEECMDAPKYEKEEGAKGEQRDQIPQKMENEVSKHSVAFSGPGVETVEVVIEDVVEEFTEVEEVAPLEEIHQTPEQTEETASE